MLVKEPIQKQFPIRSMKEELPWKSQTSRRGCKLTFRGSDFDSWLKTLFTLEDARFTNPNERNRLSNSCAGIVERRFRVPGSVSADDILMIILKEEASESTARWAKVYDPIAKNVSNVPDGVSFLKQCPLIICFKQRNLSAKRIDPQNQ